MTDPRNYMRALDRVAAMKLRPSLQFDEDCGQWHCDLAFKVGSACYSHYADDPEYAVIAALAALYDAEHA